MPKQVMQERAEIENIFLAAEVGCLATCDSEREPYVVPVNFLYHDGDIYFHSSPYGRKMANIKQNPEVCFLVYNLREIRKHSAACHFGATYESVMAFGRARVISDPGEKARILNMLTEKYAKGDSFTPVTEDDLGNVAVVRIVVEKLRGKRNVPREE